VNPLAWSAVTRACGPTMVRTFASMSATASATLPTGGPMDRNAFIGVYQFTRSSRCDEAVSPA
jgi:hypothetical protein